jgi:hypothetical protein
MASEILGLFTSPEQYNMMQQQTARNQALQFAQLDPFQRASYGVYQGAGQIANATAGLFGAQDPQLRMISQRQMLSREIDPSDPESILRAAQRAGQMGDQQFALTLSDYARKAQIDMATTQQKMREGRAAAIPKEVQIAQTRAELLDRKAQISELPDSPDKTRALAMVDNTLASLQTVARQGQIPDSIEIARELALEAGDEGSDAYTTKYRTELRLLTEKKNADKQLEQSRLLIEAGYAPGSEEYKAKMRQFVEAEITGRGKGKGNTDIKLTLPGQTKEGVKGVSEFRASVIDTVKPFRNTVTSADQAIQSINDSLKTGNFISFNAARTQLAKALGDGTLSRRDVEQAGGDPSILGGLADTASTMFTGTPTADTQKKIKSTLTAIRKVAREKGQSELAIQRQIAEQSGYDEGQMKVIFNFPEFEKKAGGTQPVTNETIPSAVANRITQPPAKGQKQTRTLKSGKTVTVETE